MTAYPTATSSATATVSNETPSTETAEVWRKDRDHFIHPWTDY